MMIDRSKEQKEKDGSQDKRKEDETISHFLLDVIPSPA
jgi:hypothetical protein